MRRKRPHPDDEGNGAHALPPKKANRRDKQGYHSGTTAVVGILGDNEFVVANAGDSKCVLSLKGILIYKSECCQHAYVQDPNENT